MWQAAGPCHGKRVYCRRAAARVNSCVGKMQGARRRAAGALHQEPPMNATLLTLSLAVLAAGQVPADKTDKTPRRPSPLAPSLPELTREEEQQLDKIIDRFMLADIGVIAGDEARAAVRDFARLGPESIPALIRGVNRAAMIEHSCPVVVIAQKLQKMLLSSDDSELLEFARDNIGSGVGPTRHMPILKELRFKVLVRKNLVARQAATPRRTMAAGPKAPPAMTTAELVTAAGKERGPRLKGILTELEGRRGKEVLTGLVTAITNTDSEGQQLGRDLLDKHLMRQNEAFIKGRLKDEQPEVRQAAVRVVAAKMPNLGRGVIDLLEDDNAAVRAAARQALVLLSRGEDFGPETDAAPEERTQAQKKWRDWWDRRGSR
jgi:hypothetical protein